MSRIDDVSAEKVNTATDRKYHKLSEKCIADMCESFLWPEYVIFFASKSPTLQIHWPSADKIRSPLHPVQRVRLVHVEH